MNLLWTILTQNVALLMRLLNSCHFVKTPPSSHIADYFVVRAEQSFTWKAKICMTFSEDTKQMSSYISWSASYVSFRGQSEACTCIFSAIRNTRWSSSFFKGRWQWGAVIIISCSEPFNGTFARPWQLSRCDSEQTRYLNLNSIKQFSVRRLKNVRNKLYCITQCKYLGSDRFLQAVELTWYTKPFLVHAAFQHIFFLPDFAASVENMFSINTPSRTAWYKNVYLY